MVQIICHYVDSTFKGLPSPGIITINDPVDYMARAVIILMQGKDIMRAIGRVGL